MTIYVDVSATVHSRAGLGRYAESLARSLLARDPGRFALFYNQTPSTRLPSGLASAPGRAIWAGYKPWRMAVWAGQLAHIGFDRLIPAAELYHATEHLLMPLRRTPCVLTIHDLVFRLFPQYHKPLNYTFLNLAVPLFVRRADRLIVVSQATSQDLVRLYGVDRDKITVIHEAADARFRPQPAEEVERVRRKYSLPERYILSLGTLEPRKNYQRLVEALSIPKQKHGVDSSRLHAEVPRLVIVGERGWLYQPFLQRLEELGLEQEIILLGRVPDEDLPGLYSGAVLFVFPSLYEGFGLPPLEAMACGTPVVCSRASSLPEVGGEAARYFSPTSSEEMAQVMHEVLVDEVVQQEMREEGMKQARRFSWEKAADETLAVYEAALKARGAA